jgi:hypothetical protein
MTKIKLALKIFKLVLNLEIDHDLLDRLSKSTVLKVIVQEVDDA